MAAGVFALAAAGCTATQERDPVGETARAWYAAVAAGDDAALCRLLTPSAVTGLETGGQSCSQAVGDLHLPTGTPSRADVWSEQAQVRAGADTLFLTRVSAGWRVAAAGCRPQQDRPYDCEVEG